MNHRLNALTNTDEVRALGVLSDAERQRIDELRARIEDLTTNNPRQRARMLTLLADRVEKLIAHLEELEEELTDEKISALVRVTQDLDVANIARQSLLEELASMPLPNTGSERWHRLWEAARGFSDSDSYTATTFPFVDAGARCVLCQQLLLEEGAERLQVLAQHADGAPYEDYRRGAAQLDSDVARLRGLSMEGSIGDTIDELAVDHPDIAEDVRRHLGELVRYRDVVLVSIEKRNQLQERAPVFDKQLLCDYRDGLRSRAAEMTSSTSGEQVDTLRLELAELEARKTLGDNIAVVLEEIGRRARLAVYEQCIRETRTHPITRKSTDVTRRAVTGQLVSAFSDELRGLGFVDVEVELAQAGGSRGSLYHKVILTRAPGSEVAKVVSEGEARCLSIASFFAEISTADDPSTILFDDPVSSLDHNWRRNVAGRLASEAQHRQVVVFTHDLTFWHVLQEEAERLQVNCETRYLRRTREGTGALSDRVPSPAMRVRDRIKYLNSRWQEADKLFRVGNLDDYEEKGSYIYGVLREAWERGVEEVLLYGVVERYRNSVQTNRRIMKLSDIGEADCRAVQDGMTRCSRYLRGHDISAADNPPFPRPEEVKADIEAFSSWVDEIRLRR